MKFNKLHILFFSLIFIWQLKICAQNPINFTTENGLSSNEVYDVFQDKNGVIWFATDRGLNSYNGFELKNYSLSDGLSDVTTFKFFPQVDGKVFCSTFNQQLYYFENGKSNFIKYKFNNLLLNELQKRGLFKIVINELKVENDNIYIKDDRNFISIVDGKFQIKKQDYQKYKMPIICQKKIGENTFLEGYRSGGAKVWSNEIEYNYLPELSVSSGLRDSFGNLWLTTLEKGVFFYNNRQSFLKEIDSSGINSLSQDQNGTIYIATTNGSTYSLIKNQLKQIAVSNNKCYGQVQYNNANNELYFYKNGFCYTLKNGQETLLVSPISKFSEAINGEIVFSSFGVIHVENGRKRIELSNNESRIFDAIRYKNGFLIALINGVYFLDQNNHLSLFNNSLKFRIDDIDYHNEKIYFASQGKGVFVLNEKTKKLENFYRKNGLSSDFCKEIYVENNNEIWVVTNYGLNHIDLSKNKIEYFTTVNNLSSNQIQDIEIANDKIYIGHHKGLDIVSKKDLFSSLKNRRYFLRLLDYKLQDSKDSIDLKNLSYDENNLVFNLSSVCFKQNKNLAYAYRLNRISENWRFVKNTNQVVLENLTAGDYELEVKVSEDNRFFSAEKLIIPFHINNPFWKTWWFATLMFFLGVTLIYLFFKFRILIYNADLVREILRLILSKIKGKERFIYIRENGVDIKIDSNKVQFIKSSGNYLDIFTEEKTFTIRCKTNDFLKLVPDPIEYIRLHRSYIVRIDKITSKKKNSVFIADAEIPVGDTFHSELDKIIFK